MKTIKIAVLSVLCLTVLLAACAPAATSTGGKLGITVSILPQQYFVERIGGELVEVNVMVGPGMDPHTYEPTPAQMEMLAGSQLYFSIGVEFEDAWLAKFQDTNPDLLIIDSGAGIEKIPMSAESDHGEGEMDPHIWLSPANVRVLAQNIANALITADPQNHELYQKNLTGFLQDIDALDQEIHNTLDPLPNRKFITFHPAWGYFARDYDLEQIAIEVGGNEPSAAELADLINAAKTNDIHVIFAQPEFNAKTAETIAREINGQVILISPLAENWLEAMRSITQSFAGSLK